MKSTSPSIPSKTSWDPVRLSGRIKFRSNSSKKRHWSSSRNLKLLGNSDLIDLEYEERQRPPEYREGAFAGCRFQFHNYCQHTSLHGFRYITERKRNISERIFWICWCLFGISSAIYMMSKIWQKWQDNPVLTSIATTNLPVSEINFPAVTICPVNKAISEKLIIQGCRFNITFSKLRKIISGLVDVESKNNDNDPLISDSVDSRVTMKYLRLVSPKCEDYLLRCELNGKKPPCSDLFKLALTDSGYCCIFNALHADNQLVADYFMKNNSELLEQEEEFEYLQKAVWQYHDQYRDKNGNPETESNFTKLPTDSLTCSRIYDDDLFPGICRYLSKCRANPGGCKLNVNVNTNTPSPVNESSSTNPIENGTIFRAPGAGRSRGLTIMTDTLRCDDIPTDSFKGVRVYVHGRDEFPAVGEKGFIVGPGKETQVGVTAIDAYSADALMKFQPSNRECYFRDELKLNYYKDYSRSSCVIECEDQYIFQQCQCVPYFSPAAGNYSICGMKKMLDCVHKAIDSIQKRNSENVVKDRPSLRGSWKPVFNLQILETPGKKTTCIDKCLPACNETFYNIVVDSATFPNQNDPYKTKYLKEAIEEGVENLADINYVSGSISLLRVYFRESTIMQYKRDELFTWEDFISNLGGVMSLCLGFSLLSLIEVIYFFTMRRINDKRKQNKIARMAKDATSEIILSSFYGNVKKWCKKRI